jgi:predicted MFS family arabinose efflux permease
MRIMRASLLLSGALLVLFPLIPSFAATLALVFLWASIAEAYRPANLAILTALAPPGQTRAVLALNRMAINLGMSIGPVVGGVLAAISYPAVFAVDGAMSILAGLLLTAGGGVSYVIPERQSVHLHASALRNWNLLYFLIALLPSMAVFFLQIGALPLFLVRDLHWSPSAYGLLALVNTVPILLLEVALNVSMRNWLHRHALALGALLTALGFGGLAFARGIASIGVAILVWTFGEMILFPGSAAYVADIAPPARSGEYMGFYQMKIGIAFMIGPWLGTIVLQRSGPTTLWIGALICGCLSAAALSRVREGPTAA